MLRRAIGRTMRDPRYAPARTVQAGWQLWSWLRAFHRPQPSGEILCRALGRYPMLVSGRDVGLAPFLVRTGAWELWIARFMRRRIRPGMTVLDAGANLGYFTVIMADAVGPTGRVIAAEPIPATQDLLRRNIANNGFEARVRVVAAALGDAAGEVELMIPEGEPKNAIIQPPGYDYALGRRHSLIRSPLMRVDDLDIERLDFAKIDVEGHELALWRGMTATLDRSPGVQIVIEVNGGRGGIDDLLDEIEARFPLQAIDTVGNLCPIRRADILATSEDTMLYLTRQSALQSPVSEET